MGTPVYLFGDARFLIGQKEFHVIFIYCELDFMKIVYIIVKMYKEQVKIRKCFRDY